MCRQNRTTRSSASETEATHTWKQVQEVRLALAKLHAKTFPQNAWTMSAVDDLKYSVK